MSDTAFNLDLYNRWDNEADTCLNGNGCDHPLCEDHNGVNFWDKTDWPPLMTDKEWLESVLV